MRRSIVSNSLQKHNTPIFNPAKYRLTALAAALISVASISAQAETVGDVEFTQSHPTVSYTDDTTVTGRFSFRGGNDLNASVTVNNGLGSLTFTSAESFNWHQGGTIAVNASTTTFTGSNSSRYKYALVKDSAQGTLTFSGDLIFRDLTAGAAIRGRESSNVSDIIAAGDISFTNVSTYEQVAALQAVSLIGKNITADNVHQTDYDAIGAAFWVHCGVLQAKGENSQGGLISVRNSSFEHGSYGSAALWADNAGQILADRVDINTIEFASTTNLDQKTVVASGIHAEAGSHIVIGSSIQVQNITTSTIQAAGLHLEGRAGIGSLPPPGGDSIDSDPATLLQTSVITIKNIKAETEGLKAFGICAQGDNKEKEGLKLTSNRLTVDTVSGTFAYGFAQMFEADSAFDSAEIANVTAETEAAGVYLRGMGSSSIRFGSLSVHDIKARADGFATLLDVGAGTVSAASATLTVQNELKYAGYFSGNAETRPNTIGTVAIRAVRDGLVGLSAEGGTYTIVGDMVAGYGKAIEASTGSQTGGQIKIAGSSTQIYGDVYAGNGGSIELTLNGEASLIEGQIDDYHELAFTDQVFRNSLFRDDEGNPLDVTQAGQITLNLNGSTWIARGQNFVDTVSFGEDAGTIDLSKSENSSATIENLKGNGNFVMRLGAYSEIGDLKSDMLYIQNAQAGSQHTIYATLGDGVSREDLENIRFATVKNGASENLFVVKVEDQGAFNLTASVKQEDYQSGDADNERFNGVGDGQGEYKPGANTVDAIFGSKDGAEASRASTFADTSAASKNYYIAGFGDGGSSLSNAGETILGTARATYWNAVIIDRFNQRYGDRVYDQNHHGVWARVKHEHIGTDAGVGDFNSDNTLYQFGYDYAKPTEKGKMVWGGALDYMNGRTDYESINGDGGTDRVGGLFYATYLADSGAYADLVLRAGRLCADYEMHTPSGTKIDADYDHWMYGFSLEAGHQLENATGWFLEPQLQAQYTRITDGDYRNQQTKVEQDAIDSFITRTGFRVGKFLSDNKATLGYFKVDVMREWMGKQGIRVFDATTAAKGADVSISNHGTWFDVGGGFQSALMQDLYAYGDIEYRFGNDFDKSWIVNIGAKYHF